MSNFTDTPKNSLTADGNFSPVLHRRILIIAIKSIRNGHQVPQRMQKIDTDFVFKQQNKLMAREALNRLNGLASSW